MHLKTLGKDVDINKECIPVISPQWRLKRSGNWVLLWKYDADQCIYMRLSPLVGATVVLFNGKLTLRQIAKILQFAHDYKTMEEGLKLATSVIENINNTNSCIVQMNDTLAPLIKNYDPENYIVTFKDFAQQTRLHTPLSLGVMFSNNCQTNCLYCYAHKRRVPRHKELSTERWKEIFQEARSLDIEQVQLSGGDPLFRKDAVELISELIRLDMLFLISTKCHITEKLADQLVSAGMTSPVNQITREIQISFDGPDSFTADRLADSAGYFERALDSIKNLVDRNFNLRVKAVVTPLNASKMYEWAQMLDSLGVTRIACAAYNRTFYRHQDNLFLSLEDRLILKEQFNRIRNDFPHIELILTGFDDNELIKFGEIAVTSYADSTRTGSDNPDVINSGKAIVWEHRSNCSGGSSSMTVTPDGKIILCDQVPQNEMFFVGDLSKQSILAAWHSERLINFAYPSQEKFNGSVCYNCRDFIECHTVRGYCFRDAFFSYGTIYAPPPKCPKALDSGIRMS